MFNYLSHEIIPCCLILTGNVSRIFFATPSFPYANIERNTKLGENMADSTGVRLQTRGYASVNFSICFNFNKYTIPLFYYLTLSPPLNQAKIGGFGGLQFLEKGDEGITVSPRINHFVQNFTENIMVKFAIF